MELILSEEQQLLADSAGRVFARMGGVKRTRELRDSATGFDRDALRAMAEHGWLGMLVPEARGGLALGPVELALLMQQAGRALVPEPLGDIALAALLIAQGGDDGAHAQLAPLVAGAAVVLPALQEPSGAIEPDAIETRATRHGDGWRLDGGKSFVLGAGGCDGFLVSARADGGPVLCHVPRDTPALEVRLSSTVEGRSYGELRLRGAAARPILSGDAADAAIRRHHGLALIAAAAEMLGVMEAASERTLDYMKTRQQFGRPIGSFQALQHRSVDNYVLIESTRSLLHQICEGGEPLSAPMLSALKATASNAALTVTKSAVQLHGAIGFTDEYDIGLYLKRAMWLSAHLGNAAAHQQRFAALA